MTKEQKTILFLLNDTDLLLLNVIKTKFQKDVGWESVISTSYDDALKVLNEKKPNAVLTEIIINDNKGRTGFDFIKEINDSKYKDQIEVMIFTELGLNEYEERAQILGVKHYFVKNKMSINELIDEIKKILI